MKGRLLKRFIECIISLLFFLTLIIFLSTGWTIANFGNVKVDSILYTLLSPMEGTDNTMIFSWLLKVLLPSAIVFIALIVLYVIIERKYKHNFSLTGKKTYRFFKVILSLTVIISLVFSCAQMDSAFGIYSYIKNQNEPTQIFEKKEENEVVKDDDQIIYQNPKDVTITGDNTKNLIFIYLESYENSFMDKENGGINEVNVMPNLTVLAKNNINFSNTELLGGASEFPGVTWTIGSMVGQSSGLPLKVSVGNNMDQVEQFMPGAITIGDVLHDKGYNQTMLIGSKKAFAGTDKFFEQHHYDSFIDYDNIKSQYVVENDEECYWGVKDHKLIEVAKDQLTQIAQTYQKFNFTMATIDCHMPDGFCCKYCPQEYRNGYENVYACQDHLISEFVSWCQLQPWYENTTIILSGDHPTKATNYIGFIPGDYVRTTYNCFINTAVTTEHTKNRNFTQMDMFPTTLAAMGFEIKGNKLALGTNLFSGTKTVVEKYGREYIENEVQKKSDYLEKNIYQKK